MNLVVVTAKEPLQNIFSAAIIFKNNLFELTIITFSVIFYEILSHNVNI
jgi:hypothetical protein